MDGVLLAVLTGGAAGTVLGYVLHRTGYCFHSTLAGAYAGDLRLLRTWTLGVALAAVGFAVVADLPGAADLNKGLAFHPVGNVLGGLLIGVGMVVARSCIAGLFQRLGSGMLGAFVGLVGWAAGELAARAVDLPDPTVLAGGTGATLPGLLGEARLTVSVVVLAAVVLGLALTRAERRGSRERWEWGWPSTGLALGAAITAAWALAAVGGSTYGASSVGAVASIASGATNSWLVCLLAGLVLGSLVAARTAGGWWLRGERPVRYGELAVGGFLLGAGGWVAGGCTMGHALSGMSQLNVSSAVAVAAMAVGVGLARRLPSLG